MGALTVEEFLARSTEEPVLDVRTPAEFLQGHLPGAVSIPLFTNDERAVIGTLYVQQGRKNAMKAGLDFIGPRMRSIVESAEQVARDGRVLVHCWRGGMRSGAVSWLLSFYGFEVHTLTGGYKSFRNLALREIAKPRRFVVVGGKTGAGKTKVLHQLCALGQPVIDLEYLAGHKGSAFGGLGQKDKTQEQFENDLSVSLRSIDPLCETDAGIHRGSIAWIEDESRTIGKRSVPAQIMQSKQEATLLFLDVPLKQRVENLVQEYGQFPVQDLANIISRLHKRLGGLDTAQALEALHVGDLERVCEIVLHYYDRAYDFELSKRSGPVIRVPVSCIDAAENASRLMQACKESVRTEAMT